MKTESPSFIHEYVPPCDGAIDYSLLLLHGTGGNERDLLPLGQRLLPGAALLSPRGKVLENGSTRFFRRISAGVFDLEDLQQRACEMTGFVKMATQEYHLDPHRVVAVGYSNGANLAAAILLLHPELLRSAVLFRPMVPLVPKKLPNLDGVSVLICGGRYDEIVAPEEAVRLAELLHEASATVSIHWSDNGHGLTAREICAARDWLQNKIAADAL